MGAKQLEGVYRSVNVAAFDLTKVGNPVMQNESCPFADGEGLDWLRKACRIEGKYVRGEDGEKVNFMRWVKNTVKAFEKEKKAQERLAKDMKNSIRSVVGGGDVDLDNPAMQVFLESMLPWNNVDAQVREGEGGEEGEGAN